MKKIAVIDIGIHSFATGPENAGEILALLASATPLQGNYDGARYPTSAVRLGSTLVDGLDKEPKKEAEPVQQGTVEKEPVGL